MAAVQDQGLSRRQGRGYRCLDQGGRSAGHGEFVNLQDLPDAETQNLLNWLKNAQAQMSKAKDALYRLGQVTELARSSAEDLLLNSKPADPNNFDENAKGAGERGPARSCRDFNATNEEMGGIGAEPPVEGLGGAGTLELPERRPLSTIANAILGLRAEQGPNLEPPPGPGTYQPRMSERAISNLEAALPPGAMAGAKTGAIISVFICANLVLATGNGDIANCLVVGRQGHAHERPVGRDRRG